MYVCGSGRKGQIRKPHPCVHNSTLVSVPTIPRTMGTRQRIPSGQDLMTFMECVSWGGVAGEVRGALLAFIYSTSVLVPTMVWLLS